MLGVLRSLGVGNDSSDDERSIASVKVESKRAETLNRLEGRDLPKPQPTTTMATTTTTLEVVGPLRSGVAVLPAVFDHRHKGLFTGNATPGGPTMTVMLMLTAILDCHLEESNRRVMGSCMHDKDGKMVGFPQDDDKWSISWGQCKKITIKLCPIFPEIPDEIIKAGEIPFQQLKEAVLRGRPTDRRTILSRKLDRHFFSKAHQVAVDAMLKKSIAIVPSLANRSDDPSKVVKESIHALLAYPTASSKKPNKSKKKAKKSKANKANMENMKEAVENPDSNNEIMTTLNSNTSDPATTSLNTDLGNEIMDSTKSSLSNKVMTSTISNLDDESISIIDFAVNSLNIVSTESNLHDQPIAAVDSKLDFTLMPSTKTNLGNLTMASGNLNLGNENRPSDSKSNNLPISSGDCKLIDPTIPSIEPLNALGITSIEAGLSIPIVPVEKSKKKRKRQKPKKQDMDKSTFTSPNDGSSNENTTFVNPNPSNDGRTSGDLNFSNPNLATSGSNLSSSSLRTEKSETPKTEADKLKEVQKILRSITAAARESQAAKAFDSCALGKLAESAEDNFPKVDDPVGINKSIKEYFQKTIIAPLGLISILELPDEVPLVMLSNTINLMYLWNLDWEFE